MHECKDFFFSVSDPSGSNLFFLSSLFWSHRSRISAVIQGFLLLTMFAKDLTRCFSHCRVEPSTRGIYRYIEYFSHCRVQPSARGILARAQPISGAWPSARKI